MHVICTYMLGVFPSSFSRGANSTSGARAMAFEMERRASAVCSWNKHKKLTSDKQQYYY
jgi:hypothetical protein